MHERVNKLITICFKSPLQIQIQTLAHIDSSAKAVCSARHEAMQEYKPINRLTTQLNPSSLAAVLLSRLLDVCPFYRHCHSKNI